MNSVSINKKFCFLLFKTTNDFLLKLTAKQTVASVKSELTQLAQASPGLKFIEIEDEYIPDENNFLLNLIKLLL